MQQNDKLDTDNWQLGSIGTKKMSQKIKHLMTGMMEFRSPVPTTMHVGHSN